MGIIEQLQQSLSTDKKTSKSVGTIEFPHHMQERFGANMWMYAHMEIIEWKKCLKENPLVPTDIGLNHSPTNLLILKIGNHEKKH